MRLTTQNYTLKKGGRLYNFNTIKKERTTSEQRENSKKPWNKKV